MTDDPNRPVADPLSAARDPLPKARPVIVTTVIDGGSADPMRLAQIRWTDALLQLLAVLLVGLAFSAVAALVTAGVYGNDPQNWPHWIQLSVTQAMWLVCVLVAVVLIMRSGGSLASLGITTRGLLRNLAIGLLVAGGSHAAFLLTAVMMKIVWPAGFLQLTNNAAKVEQIIPRGSPPVLFGTTLLIACLEEVIFRGIFTVYLRRLLGSWVLAIVVGTAVFAALHTQTQVPATAFPLFAAGVLWATVTVWRRSLVPAIVGHTLFNFLTLMYLYYWSGPAVSAS